MVGQNSVDCKTSGKAKKDNMSVESKNNKKKFQGKCYHCGIFSHMEQDCYKKNRMKKEQSSSTTQQNTPAETSDVVMMTARADFGTINKNTWLGDTGSSAHMTNSMEGMFDVKQIQENIRIGDGTLMQTVAIGSKRVFVIQKDGDSIDVTLKKVKFVPNMWTSLFSITAAISHGFKATSEGEVLQWTKGKFVFCFDQVIKTPLGFVLGIQLIPQSGTELGNMMVEGHQVEINNLHCLLGHASEAKTRATAKDQGWIVKGRMTKCKDCAISKAKPRNVSKASGNKSTVEGEPLLSYLSSTKAVSAGGAKFWILIVDKATDMKWSYFVKLKGELKGKVVDFIKELKSRDNKFGKYIPCDYAGENKKLHAACVVEELGITFKYTAPGTLQSNGTVEQTFDTLYGQVRAIMNHARFLHKARNDL